MFLKKETWNSSLDKKTQATETKSKHDSLRLIKKQNRMIQPIWK